MTRSCVGSVEWANRRTRKFEDLSKYLCEVRNQQYWRLGYGSFEEFLEDKFPDSRRKAHYLMSITGRSTADSYRRDRESGLVQALELAKVAGSQGGFDSATWLHKAQECSKEELKEEMHQYFTWEDLEPHEMVYRKLFESQLPIIGRALYVASRMAGTERPRGYCLELVCADSLAGRTEEFSPEETLLVIERLASLVPPEYLARVVSQLQSCAAV